MPRPTTFSEDTADAICERLVCGESLRSICQDEAMPARSTVAKWLADTPAFAAQYAYARQMQADALFDEIIHIADTPEVGEKRTVKPDGSVEIVQADMIEHRRLKVHAREWSVARLAPKKYGDRLGLEVASADDDVLALLQAGRERARGSEPRG